MPDISPASVERAMRILREADNNGVDYADINPEVRAVLEACLTDIRHKIRRYPDSYIMSSLEFSVYNRFRNPFEEDAACRRAVERYWHNENKPNN